MLETKTSSLEHTDGTESEWNEISKIRGLSFEERDSLTFKDPLTFEDPLTWRCTNQGSRQIPWNLTDKGKRKPETKDGCLKMCGSVACVDADAEVHLATEANHSHVSVTKDDGTHAQIH